MAYCPNCGSSVNDGEETCRRCRGPLPQGSGASKPQTFATSVPLRSPQRGLVLGSLSDAVVAIQKDPSRLLGFFFLVLAINFVVSFGVGFSSKSGAGGGIASQGISLVAYVFFVGYLFVAQKTLRGATATAKDLLVGFPKIVPILLAYLLCFLISLLVLAVTLIPLLLALIAWFSISFLSDLSSGDFFNQFFAQGASDPNFLLYILLGVLGLFLLFTPVVVISLGFVFWPLRILDGEHGVLESLRQSWELTRGHKRHLTLLFLLFIPLNLAGLLLLIVGIFLTLPISAVALVAFYERLLRPEP